MTRTAPSSVLERIAQLSPEKRRLLTRLLTTGETGASPADPQDASLLITRDAVSSDEGRARGHRLYELVNQNLDRGAFAAHAVFLNLGYVPNQSPQRSPIVLPKRCLNRNCLQLALETIADTNLDGREVVDVGCGRGGTIAAMRTYFAPRRVVGVDYSRSALAFCRRTHLYPDTHFVEGNAQALPLRTSSLDAVTNVESASSYSDVVSFFREAARVLRPGGYFLYADVIPRTQLPERRRCFADLGFEIESERDITENVILSCDETAQTHRTAIGYEHDAGVLGDFLALPGSAVYRGMSDGTLAYQIYKNRRIER
jgi:phthiocerol/phenolphthiocerol synthesis type-I polyketide synthase E